LLRHLADFPHTCSFGSAVIFVIGLASAYRLARLAVKFGSEVLLDDLLVRLSADCPWRDDPRGSRCGIYCRPTAAAPTRYPGAEAIARNQRRQSIERVSSATGARLVRSSPQAGCSAPLRPGGDRAAFRGAIVASGRRASRSDFDGLRRAEHKGLMEARARAGALVRLMPMRYSELAAWG